MSSMIGALFPTLPHILDFDRNTNSPQFLLQQLCIRRAPIPCPKYWNILSLRGMLRRPLIHLRHIASDFEDG